MTTTGKRARWTCGTCGMVVRHAEGRSIPAPFGWEGDTCFVCRREAALRDKDWTTVVEMELRRGATIPQAQKAVYGRLKEPQIKRIQRRLEQAGEIASPQPKVNGRAVRRREQRERVGRELHADPSLTDAQVAEAVGCSGRTVHRVRAELGLPRPPSQRGRRLRRQRETRERIDAELQRDAERFDTDIAKICRCSCATVRARREELGIPTFSRRDAARLAAVP